MNNEERQLFIDTCFMLVLHATSSQELLLATQHERAKWVAHNLEQIGYPTKPVGSSWGVLQKK